MSTLVEIEEAVETLPRVEQETLWQHLSHRLFNPSGKADDAARRKVWLEKLRQIRERNETGRSGAPLQQVMDELREERT